MGDVLCIVSDGVTEAARSWQARSTERRASSARSRPRATAREAVDALRSDVAAFVGTAVQSDDMTVLALQWRGATGMTDVDAGVSERRFRRAGCAVPRRRPA